MSLMTYDQARPWASSIAKEVAAKRMPPFHADGPPGYYKDDNRLTENEIHVLVRWAETGAPRGNPEDQPAPVQWDTDEWPAGLPDQILSLPRLILKPSQLDEWWTLYSAEAFTEDTWIRGVQLPARPGSALHHAHVMVIEPGEPIPANGTSRQRAEVMGRQPIETWFPGLQPYLLPDGQGLLIPKGSRIALQVHFGPNSNGIDEQLAIGLHHANGLVDSTFAILGAREAGIDIPPYAPDYVYRSTNTFEVSGAITHFRAHMHLRGKSARIMLHYPDGTSEIVFDLPRFNFDWQRYYVLAEPKRVPAGTIAEFIGTWDNSESNPLNPDPSQRVRNGFRTSDEMFGLKIFYTPDVKLTHSYIVENGRVKSMIENPDTGPWIVFWNRVMRRDWLEQQIRLNAPAVQPSDHRN